MLEKEVKPKTYCVYWKNIADGTYGQIYTVAFTRDGAFLNAMKYLQPKMWHDMWIERRHIGRR